MAMAVTRTRIHSKTKGALAENEDWWVLIVDIESGSKSVEHEWSYTNAYGSGQDSGKTTVTVDEFLASGADDAVKMKLRAMLDAGV
jgi:hypothetical protein